MKKNYLNPVTEIVRVKSSNPVMDELPGAGFGEIPGLGMNPVSQPVTDAD